LTIHTDARVYLASLDAGQQVTQELAPGRHAWLQVLRGAVTLNGQPLATSDGAAVSEEITLAIAATEAAEVMLFDLA
jgi:redox-sensitive bicupin YhaK (pirin superfamily)